MILLDTQVLLWLRVGDPKLGRAAQLTIDQAWGLGQVGVSSISFWEIEMLKKKCRIRFPEDVELWRREQSEPGMNEIPIDGQIGISAASLSDFHADPADRLIMATALEGMILLTADSETSIGPVNWTVSGLPTEQALYPLSRLS